MMNNIPRNITSVLFCLGLLVSMSVKAASINIVAVESGGNVVMSASGAIDLLGLTASGSSSPDGSINPSTGATWVGDGVADRYRAYFFPSPTYGPGGQTFSDFGTGSTVGIFGSLLYVPAGYSSGDPLVGISSTYLGETFATLGMTPGTYDWTFINGQTLSLEISQVPLPAAAWLFISALGGLVVEIGRAHV